MRKLLTIIALFVCVNAYAEKIDFRMTGQSGDHYFFTVPKSHSHNKDFLMDRAKNFCYDKNHCFVHFWEAGVAAPKKFPLSDKEVDTEIMMYSQNKYKNFTQFLYNCKYFTDQKTNCF